MITDAEIEKALDWLRDNAKQAGIVKATREYLDEYRKVLKATIMREVDNESLGASEARAYADPRYKAHLDAYRIAIEEDEYLRWMRTAAESKISAWQSENANQRAMSKVV
jgi:hypothetical protein